MKRGRSLERLVETLERVLANQDDIVVESPKRLPDKITGRLREHDVVLTINSSHHRVLIAIECRDLSRPITVNQVEGFWAKCQHTGINQAVIVSPKGFYESARIKAEKLGVRCLDLEQVSSLNWLLTKGITIFYRQIRHTNWTVNLLESTSEKISDFSLLDSEGNVITPEILLNLVQNQLSQQELGLDDLQQGVGNHNLRIRFPGDGVFLQDKENKRQLPVKWLIADVEYELKAEFSPFHLIKYADKTQGVELIDAAVVEIKFGDKEEGKILIAYKESEGGRIVYMPRE